VRGILGCRGRRRRRRRRRRGGTLLGRNVVGGGWRVHSGGGGEGAFNHSSVLLDSTHHGIKKGYEKVGKGLP